jgi:hypothetical protein
MSNFVFILIVLSWAYLGGEVSRRLPGESSLILEATSVICGASIGIIIVWILKYLGKSEPKKEKQ